MNTDLIEQRIHNFLGYGNIKSNFWFFGMEEGFNGTMKELEKRFINTHHKHTFDAYEDMKDVKDHIKWFSKNPPLQNTMKQLIRLYLSFRNQDNISTDKIRNYQELKFGRLSSDTCSLNLMPLPCKSTNERDWFYDKYNLDYLESRKTYFEKILPLRIKLYRNILSKYNPEVVVFYSLSYLDYWKKIIGKDFKKINNRLYYAKVNKTNFYVIPHPSAFGIKNDFWLESGKLIRTQIIT